VRVLDGVTDLDKQIQPLFSREIVLVAVVGDLDSRTSSMTK